MKETSLKRFFFVCVAAMAAVLSNLPSLAQEVLFTENFETPDSGTNWTVNAASARDTAEFGFDYSTVGIPAAPNAGGTTRGLLLRANRPLDVGALSGVSVSPTDRAFTNSYVLEFDLWENFPGPAPGGGTGSTQLTGAGIMTSGTVPHYAGTGDGLWFAATGEGGSSSDYRAYFGGVNQTSASLYPAGGEAETLAYYQTNFPGGVSAPAAQIALYPMQTNTTAKGTIGWAWHHVKIRKESTIVTWTIDNVLMATIDIAAAGITFGGDNILFAQSDINGGQTTTTLDPVLFGLIDNVKVTALPNVEITAVLMDPDTVVVDTISEANLDTIAAFRISRGTNNIDSDQVVNFTFTGTATRGTSTNGDYFVRTNAAAVALDPSVNSITLPAGTESVLLEIVPRDDAEAELTETIIFKLASGPYTVGQPSGATVSLLDNEPPVIDISEVVFSRMFEANTNDLIRLILQRRGDINAASFDVNLSYSGPATPDQDFVAIPTMTFNPGDATATLDLHPINDSATEQPETLFVSVAAGTGYAIGTNAATSGSTLLTIVDDDAPEGTVLFSDDFNTDTSANWAALFGSLNPETQNYSLTFNFDYGAPGVDLPPAPHSNGDTLGLFMSVNKLDAANGQAAGLNLYPIGKDFSGNYALRFDMFLMQNGTAATTENAIFGINHDTTHTNWYSNSAGGVPDGWGFDGIWASVVADASSLPGDPRARDYQIFAGPGATIGGLYGPNLVAGREATTLTNVFHQPPWTPGSGAGSPGNSVSSTTPSWAEVELSQIAGVIRLTINNTNILTYTNSTSSTHGDVMIGYNDAYNSVGTGGGGFVIYDNIRVIDLGGTTTPPDVHISTITRAGDNVQIDFTAGPGEPITAFKLVSATTVTGPYADDNTAAITSLGGSNYRITTSATDAMRFYQIRRAP
jgi:hypothetical protein